jgi:hypothetical protein
MALDASAVGNEIIKSSATENLVPPKSMTAIALPDLDALYIKHPSAETVTDDHVVLS